MEGEMGYINTPHKILVVYRAVNDKYSDRIEGDFTALVCIFNKRTPLNLMRIESRDADQEKVSQ